MVEISFYALETHSQLERQIFACKLIEKIYRNGHSCYVLTDSQEQAGNMDKLLWTYRPGSFIPHRIFTGIIPDLTQTVLIGGAEIPENWQNWIVNLSELIPVVHDQAERILEILDNTEHCKQAGRQRYRHYQQLGLKIVTHRM